MFLRPLIKSIKETLENAFECDFEYIGETFYQNRVFVCQNDNQESVFVEKPKVGNEYLYYARTRQDGGYFPQFAIFKGSKPFPKGKYYAGVGQVTDDFVRKYLN